MGKLFALLITACSALATAVPCPGYTASDVKHTPTGLTAQLKLAGRPCDLYGTDLKNLVLQVEYQTDKRLHVQIYDAAEEVWQIPSYVLDPPQNGTISASQSELVFAFSNEPFSFTVTRRKTGEVLFSTKGSHIIFESQYLRLQTSLPSNPNIYGLGEDTDAFRRNTTNYTRTLWSRDAYGTPEGTNLYGNHPIYFDHREASKETHGVFLFNSNGMDIKINNTAGESQYLEYNTLGGIIDLYFLAGPSPIEVAQQYSEVVGKSALMPYWGYGFHQCKYGYSEYLVVAEVVQNYSDANIPLETMWTDIDYMDRRRVFSLDPTHFPIEKVRQLVDHLHEHNQHYVVMVDPAVAYVNYTAFNNGVEQGIFLKNNKSEIYQGVVWPGVTAYPDWFKSETQEYWNSEFGTFFNAETGVDIDALWIDMNEAANFCAWPCADPVKYANDNGYPPAPGPFLVDRPQLPGWPANFSDLPSEALTKRQSGDKLGLPNRNLIFPKYKIGNAAGQLGSSTIETNVIHENGIAEYDAHNLYGTAMSSASRTAMLARRPNVRPLIITRSTFAGAGAKVGKWLGDNFSSWWHYRISISQALSFAALYQIPMVGADICGFGGNTTENLCARWAMLGAFHPFYRNHAESNANFQEFYRWPLVAAAARKAIAARYQLLDYLYTATYAQSTTGTPSLLPLFFLYPNDTNTFGIDLQFFFGQNILISPVTEENATSATIYLPDDIFYDFWTGASIRGTGAEVTLDDVAFDDIPVHVRGGSIVPLRVKSAYTTTELRKENFELLIAPGLDGSASGSLYLDDGESLVQDATSLIHFEYKNGVLTVSGMFGYQTDLLITDIKILGLDLSLSSSSSASVQGSSVGLKQDGNVAIAVANMSLTQAWSLELDLA